MCECTEHEGAEVATFTLPFQCGYHAPILCIAACVKVSNAESRGTVSLLIIPPENSIPPRE